MRVEYLLPVGFLFIDLIVSCWILFNWNSMSIVWIQVGLFSMSLFFFHSTEWLFVAWHNPSFLSHRSFLLSNPAYNGFLILSMIEHFVKMNYFPFFSTSNQTFRSISISIGLVMIIVGESIRKIAQFHSAKSNFTHSLMVEKRETHKLVTTGIYSLMRHPGYCGFYMWAVGTQFLLFNPINIVLFAVVLWFFFAVRIFYEEQYLLEFFSNAYVKYQKNVPNTGIPFQSLFPAASQAVPINIKRALLR